MQRIITLENLRRSSHKLKGFVRLKSYFFVVVELEYSELCIVVFSFEGVVDSNDKGLNVGLVEFPWYEKHLHEGRHRLKQSLHVVVVLLKVEEIYEFEFFLGFVQEFHRERFVEGNIGSFGALARIVNLPCSVGFDGTVEESLYYAFEVHEA